jgi:tetratricopeptide (TPR) repeat protein
VAPALPTADRAQELLAYDDAIRTLTRARDAVAAAGNPPALCARVLLATGEARIRRGEVEAGKADCREAATIARTLDDAELAARAALAYGRVFTFGLVDPVLVDMIETSLAALPPGDNAWRARLLARLGGALQPSLKAEEPVRVAREAIAIARRLGDKATLLETLHDGISALMDIVPWAEPRALNLEAERLAMELGDRDRLLRTHGRLALAHLALGAVEAADARIAAFETLASELKAPWMGWRGGLLRAARATMEGRFDESERLAAEARRMGKAAGDPVVDTVWTTNREGLLRAAERHEELAAFEPDVCRSRAALHLGPFWQSLQSIIIRARLEQHDQVRLQMDLLPEGSLSSLDNLFPTLFAAEAAALVGPRELAEEIYDRIRGLSGECSVLGMSYMSWEGPWARVLGLLAAYLGRWEEARAHFEEARALCRRLRARPYLARTEYEYGRALLARDGPGDRERARALLTSAREVAVELNMPGLVKFADARLAKPGKVGSIGSIGAPSAAVPAPGATTSAPAAEAPELPFSFTLEGEYWTVRCPETTFRLKDSLGLQYLVRLFGDPGREIHVLDLVGERAGAGANEAVDTGDAGELLDEEARRSYKDRLEDLRETLAEAESFGDGARAERARAEMEMLAAELGRAVGLGGRVRRAGGAAERARSAVQRRIKNALERIGEHAPALATYLGRTVKTGNACVFRPDPV